MHFGFDLKRSATVSAAKLIPNRWDFLAFALVIGLLAMMAIGFHETMEPMATLQTHPVSLDPTNLPEYALRTTLRMLAAMLVSLGFTLLYGALAAKNRRAEKLLIPMLDILQSVPVLGYISFTVTFFMALLPGKVLGAELAAIFAIFTSQAWNMAFSFYQSLRTVPDDLLEVSRGFHLTGWQRFWKLEVPFAMPGLVWNMMMSMSGAWFFIVASEAVTVGKTAFNLPGIGSYLALAITERDVRAIGWAILMMVLVILAYDQLLFRPLVAWADKFRLENTTSGKAPQSWLLGLMRRTLLIHRVLVPVGALLRSLARMPLRLKRSGATSFAGTGGARSRLVDGLWSTMLLVMLGYISWRATNFVAAGVGWAEVVEVLVLGLITLVRVAVLILLASLVWVPVGIWIGLRPSLAERIQPLVQFLAAFPANLLFPVFVIVILGWGLNPDIWLSPLIVLGTQWYILFNVMAGASAYPNEYREVAANFNIRGWQWWRKLMLPGVFPYYVTGAITASGGAWNASIVSEYVQWGHTKIAAHGLGAFIAQATADGDFPKIILGIAVMALYVTLFNRLLWRPLYAYAESRLRLD